MADERLAQPTTYLMDLEQVLARKSGDPGLVMKKRFPEEAGKQGELVNKYFDEIHEELGVSNHERGC